MSLFKRCRSCERETNQACRDFDRNVFFGLYDWEGYTPTERRRQRRDNAVRTQTMNEKTKNTQRYTKVRYRELLWRFAQLMFDTHKDGDLDECYQNPLMIEAIQERIWTPPNAPVRPDPEA